MSTRVAFLALGTRGDVQPLALVAAGLAEARQDYKVTIGTHAAHEDWLPDVVGDRVACSFLSATPSRNWGAPPAAGTAAAPAVEVEAHREEVIAFCEQALKRRLPQPSRNGSGRGAAKDASAAAAARSRSQNLLGVRSASPKGSPRSSPRTTPDAAARRPALLVFNLFALEGFHIAEALGILCYVLSPCLVPYAPPASFARRFRMAFPKLYKRLESAEQGQVGWSDVEHWLWPLFTERWGSWRKARLGLSAIPFMDCVSANRPLPPAVPLLYGLSDSVVPRPGYWPPSVHQSGFWHQAAQKDLLEVAQGGGWEGVVGQVLRAADDRYPIICFDFGSMGKLGFLKAPTHTVRVLTAVLRRVGARGLLLTGGWQALLDACTSEAEPSPCGSGARLVALGGSVVHASLLPRCTAVVHHGGAGTTGAVMRAGVPQVVCPLQFDQFFWAARVEHIGAGKELAKPKQLYEAASDAPEAVDAAAQLLLAALKAALQPEVVLRAREVSHLLLQEAGLQAAAQALCARIPGDPAFSGPTRTSSDSGAKPPRSPGPSARVSLESHGSGVSLSGPSLVTAARAAATALLAGGTAAGTSAAAQMAALVGAGNRGGSVLRSEQQVPVLLGDRASSANSSLDSSATNLPSAPTSSFASQQTSAATAGAGGSASGSVSAQPVQSFAGGAADRADTPPDNPAPQLVTLAGGLDVYCVSPEEARFIHDEIFTRRCYLQHGITVHTGDVVVDVGANVGLFALSLLHPPPVAPAPSGIPKRIWAIEPLPPTLEALWSNLDLHSMGGVVRVLPTAVGSARGEADFTYFPLMPGNSTQHPAEKRKLQRPYLFDGWYDGAQTIPCQVTTLSALIRQHRMDRIDLLKIDVEGDELGVLQGISEEGHWGRIRQVVAEVHDVVDPGGGRVAAIEQLLRQRGFAVATDVGMPPCNRMVYGRRVAQLT